jgi:hypothetical protein
MADLFMEATPKSFTRLLKALAVDVIEPSMIDTADAAIFDAPVA